MQFHRLFTDDRPRTTVIPVVSDHRGSERVPLPLFGFFKDTAAKAIFEGDAVTRLISSKVEVGGKLYYLSDGHSVLFVPVGQIDDGLEELLLTAGQQVASVAQEYGLSQLALAFNPEYVKEEKRVRWLATLLAGYRLGNLGLSLDEELRVYTDPEVSEPLLATWERLFSKKA